MSFTFDDRTPQAVARLRRSVARVLPEAVAGMVERAASYAPVDTGELRDSIRALEVPAGADAARFEVGSDSDYAVFAHEGLGNHRVAHKFIERALREGSADLQAALREELSEA